jgi:signal transduction histidine kinase
MGTVIKTLSLDYETAAIADAMENFSAFVREILRRPEMVDALERMAMLEKQVEARGKALAVYRDALDDIVDCILVGDQGHVWAMPHQEARKKIVRILNKSGRGWD